LELETVRRLSAVTIAIAFEDSPNGGEGGGNLHGRRSNGVTASLGLDGADLMVEQLAELPLHELLVRF
jgi:hypothetical protein